MADRSGGRDREILARAHSLSGRDTTARAAVAAGGDSHALFGGAVAIDGDTIVVGALGWWSPKYGYSGKVYLFERDKAGSWVEASHVVAFDYVPERFGDSVAIDGERLLVGDRSSNALGQWSGAAFLYAYRDGNWTGIGKLLPSDADGCQCDPWGDCYDCEFFGDQVALDGDTAIGSADGLTPVDGDGFAYVFSPDAAEAGTP